MTVRVFKFSTFFYTGFWKLYFSRSLFTFVTKLFSVSYVVFQMSMVNVIDRNCSRCKHFHFCDWLFETFVCNQAQQKFVYIFSFYRKPIWGQYWSSLLNFVIYCHLLSSGLSWCFFSNFFFFFLMPVNFFSDCIYIIFLPSGTFSNFLIWMFNSLVFILSF